MSWDIIDSGLINSLGMTLIHSLWQILAVYIILRIVLSLLKGSESNARYNISALAMLIVLLLSIATFSFYQNIDTSDESLVFYHLVQNNEQGSERVLSYPIPQANELNITIEDSEFNYLPWLVLGYLGGIIFLSFRLLIGIIYLRKYKFQGIVKISAELEELFFKTLKKIRIRREVRILESVLTQVPFILGYFKPVVIVPVGIFTHLPYNQVEAIIAHELAHIKRNDFLVNIVQSIIELLFFYHPAIYLISRHIRDERENSCDDIALQFVDDNKQYIEALASMESLRLTVSYPAVAFVKKKSNLLERVKRILKPNKMKTKLSDRIFAGIIIILGLSTIMITGAAALNSFSAESNMDNSEETSINLNSLYGETPVSDTIIDFDDGKIITNRKNEKGKNEKIEMVFDNGELTQLVVNGKEVEKKEYPQYKEVVKSTLVEVRKAQTDIEEATKDMEQFDEAELHADIAKAMAELENIDKEAIMLEVEEAMAEARREMEQINMEEIRAEIEKAMKEIDVEEIRAEVAEAMEEVDWEEINKEIAEAMKEVEIEMDEANKEIEEAMNEIDWEEVRKEIEEAMKDAEMSKEEIEIAMNNAMAGLEAIDWDIIGESVNLGLEAAMMSLEGLDEIIGGSVELGLGIASEVLENLDETIYKALEGVEAIDPEEIVREIEEARNELSKEGRKLDELEADLETTLEKMEADSLKKGKKEKPSEKEDK